MKQKANSEFAVDGAVHAMFGLTYASYLVYPRSVLQRMPHEWQEKFADLFNELHDTLEYDTPDYYVISRKGNRIVKDPLREYRRPDDSLIKRNST